LGGSGSAAGAGAIAGFATGGAGRATAATCRGGAEGFNATYTMPEASIAPAAKASTIFELIIMSSFGSGCKLTHYSLFH
jgi:hypothetical protein